MKTNDIKKEINDIESEKLKKSVAEAVNCFVRLETLYKIKCKELEVAEEKARKETAREILQELTTKINDLRVGDDENYLFRMGFDTLKEYLPKMLNEYGKKYGVEVEK